MSSSEEGGPIRQTRRQVLRVGQSVALVGVCGAALSIVGSASAGPILPGRGDQPEWRYCSKCHAMFYDADPVKKGVCPKGGGHVSEGYRFRLHYDDKMPGNPNPAQYAWRFCSKCWVLFFDGYPSKGKCAAGGAHTSYGFMFGLARFSPGGWNQNRWGYCSKCEALHYYGYADRGVCPAGGAHVQQGWEFFLPYENPGVATPPSATTQSAPAAAYNSKVLQYAQQHLGQFVWSASHSQHECGELAVAALAYAGAKPGDMSSRSGDYIWGRQLNLWSEAPLPGDILQLVDAYLKGPNGYWYTDTQHTAIIETISNGKTLGVIQQNAPVGDPVERGVIDLNWTLTRGSYKIFRPIAP